MGILLIIVGFLIRWVSIINLKEAYSHHLLVPQSIFRNGLYKYIRHPMYLGSIFIIVGGYIINDLFGFILLTIALFLHRATIEEQINMGNKEYSKYIKETGMFLPRIRKKYG
jgi:protein-S-isoprenylcysteine O-methyltransferase Ste14